MRGDEMRGLVWPLIARRGGQGLGLVAVQRVERG